MDTGGSSDHGSGLAEGEKEVDSGCILVIESVCLADVLLHAWMRKRKESRDAWMSLACVTGSTPVPFAEVRESRAENRSSVLDLITWRCMLGNHMEMSCMQLDMTLWSSGARSRLKL